MRGKFRREQNSIPGPATNAELNGTPPGVEATGCGLLGSKAMSSSLPPPPQGPDPTQPLWCPVCARPVADPLVCGDCSAVICRVCGTPLENPDELAFG